VLGNNKPEGTTVDHNRCWGQPSRTPAADETTPVGDPGALEIRIIRKMEDQGLVTDKGETEFKMGIEKESGQKKVQYAFRRMGNEGKRASHHFTSGWEPGTAAAAGSSHPRNSSVFSAWSCGPAAWAHGKRIRARDGEPWFAQGPSSRTRLPTSNTNPEFCRRNRPSVKGGGRRCAATRLSQNDKVSRRQCAERASCPVF
jgi:hypothetical protein